MPGGLGTVWRPVCSRRAGRGSHSLAGSAAPRCPTHTRAIVPQRIFESLSQPGPLRSSSIVDHNWELIHPQHGEHTARVTAERAR